jgi:hypothetical protein
MSQGFGASMRPRLISRGIKDAEGKPIEAELLQCVNTG